ncbi:ABC transporter ATP-binding protein [Maledivibacter halophilus]|uniref:ATP-binding cassette, subfamily B n=1 Tax=Maledivibacter halophilus TaxID=36842 RepID=A0A1T5M8M2_9FIRM|nr:ABC transporter ATP-binding protein [Maledivibacter halophilus]SKC84485.1 ATP-binding cassette, subfamily B [Maledivibacter halophilus]
MLSIVKRLINFSGKYSLRLKWAIIFSILESFTINGPIIFILYGLIKINDNTLVKEDVVIAASGVVISVILRALFRRLVDGLQSGTGYKIFADERMKIGDYLKKLPTGYFTEGNVGYISAVLSSDLNFIEEHGMSTLSKIVSGSIGVIISSIIIIILDYRIGIVVSLTTIASFVILDKLFKKSSENSMKKQEVQSKLVSAVIEYVKGISVIKAFNLEGQKSKATYKSFKDTRNILIKLEKSLLKPFLSLDVFIALGTGAVIFLASYFVTKGTMELPIAFMMMIFIYQIFLPFRVIGSALPLGRIMIAGLDRYGKLMEEKILKENNTEVNLNNFDIEFHRVSFAYEKEKVLKDISFKAKEKTMTALVGPSGCGKTTIANLIARFWDIEKGSIKIGGIDIREMGMENLLKNISMVFQRVYLFNDTILNNIKFSKPEATMEEVIKACKKARCHNFIMDLENGYDTIVGEAGATLSGGEKQRISIARAILKDAPIILLDEATASVDPDNEKHIQRAIDELIKEKTIIVIAHKLSTINDADQILVLNEGKIVQRGTHGDLIRKRGKYNDLWEKRMEARSWKINTSVS